MALPSIIAIDGPAASGKTTIGRTLAKQLDYLYFDTGAMYRAVTWVALKKGFEIGDEASVVKVAQTVMLDVVPPANADDGRPYTVLADGEDVTWQIREAEVDENVSQVSAYPGVRTALSAQQRRIGLRGQVVMIGRDIGTVVLPEADLKMYFDASVEVRARRRWEENKARGEGNGYETILEAMRRRDDIDSHRAHSPLKVAEDAIVVDTGGLSIEEVMAKVRTLLEQNTESEVS